MTNARPLPPRVRGIFLLTAALLVAQNLFILVTRTEPYPAVLMPGFGGSGAHRESGLVLRRVEVVFEHREDPVSVVSAEDLLATFPRGHWSTLTRRHLPVGRRVDSALTSWLKSRCATLVPGRPTDRATIRWFEETVPEDLDPASYRLGSGARTPVAELVIDLGEGG